MSQLTLSGPILLIGSKGLLGSEIALALTEACPEVSLIRKDSASFDITQPSVVKKVIEETRPQWIINAAAYTDVDKAEREREKAKLINADGPAYLAETASTLGSRLIHFSTDYVFSGEGERPWSETDIKKPVSPNWYGETKLMGENSVLKYPEHLLFRVQWLYGAKRDRFKSLRERETFSAFIDQFGAPTWTRDVAKILLLLISQQARGSFHFAYDDFASWMDVYQFVKDELKLSVKLLPTLTSEANLPALRPRNGRLSNEKLKMQLGLKSLGSWKSSLKEFLQLGAG